MSSDACREWDREDALELDEYRQAHRAWLEEKEAEERREEESKADDDIEELDPQRPREPGGENVVPAGGPIPEVGGPQWDEFLEASSAEWDRDLGGQQN